MDDNISNLQKAAFIFLNELSTPLGCSELHVKYLVPCQSEFQKMPQTLQTILDSSTSLKKKSCNLF